MATDIAISVSSSVQPQASSSPSYTANPDRLLKLAQQARYVKEVWWFLASVIAAMSLIHYGSILLKLYQHRRQLNARSVEEKSGEAAIPGGTGKICLRRLPNALISTFRIIFFRWTIPIGTHSVASVAELLFIAGYISGLLVWEFANSKSLEVYLWEDRAAHLASCQIPLIVALASKNSIITLLTGVSHEQLNVLHRAAGRTCLLLLWVHALARHSTGLTGHFDLANGWMRSGVTGLTALTLAFFLSLRPIRRSAFEFFLCAHIVLIAIFIIGGFMHAREPGFGIYFWPGLILWGFDRTVRLLRLLVLNRVWCGLQKTRASVELLAADTVRLTFRRNMFWKPGQHVFLNLPGISTFPAELHPFTIASIPRGAENGSDKVVCIIRAREGLTKRLRDHVVVNGTAPITVLVDGPYGCPPNLCTSSTVVLIAGGSGVTFTLPLLADIICRSREGTAAVTKILWIWTVRDGAHLRWIESTLCEACLNMPPHLILDARVYISGPSQDAPTFPVDRKSDEDVSTPSTDSDSEDSEKKHEWNPTLNFPYQTRQGRPDVHQILEEATVCQGHVSVSVAGPPQLAQAVRGALRSKLASPWGVLGGRPTIELHTESFGTVRG
ncbi:hypothetical protein K439DRAFT_1504455 [Ramaria rubella]|nr:hypothetical protein K439DRAFT_1504455 [Ramaria rubella]